jgi:hypothetical protein
MPCAVFIVVGAFADFAGREAMTPTPSLERDPLRWTRLTSRSNVNRFLFFKEKTGSRF